MKNNLVFAGANVPLQSPCPKFEHSNQGNHPHAIRWMESAETIQLPMLAQEFAHLIFFTSNLDELAGENLEISDKTVHPDGSRSVFLEINGAPVKLIQDGGIADILETNDTSDGYEYHSFWIPRTQPFKDDTRLAEFKMHVNHLENDFGVGWVRYDDDAPYDQLIRTVPHLAFEVESIKAAVAQKSVLIAPKQSQPGLRIAFVEIGGFPIEYLEIDYNVLPNGV